MESPRITRACIAFDNAQPRHSQILFSICTTKRSFKIKNLIMFSNDRTHINQVNLFICVSQTLQGNLSEKWLELILTF